MAEVAAQAGDDKPQAESVGKRALVGVLLAVVPIIFFICSIAVGSYHISPWEVCQAIWGKITNQTLLADAMAVNLVWNVRLPRALAAALVGAGLSIAGAVFQGLFKNPLASPYTLGVSNGAGFGAGLAIILSFSAAATQAVAVAFGLAAVGLTFLFGARGRRTDVTLILSGMLVGSLFSSLVSLLKFVADPTEKLPQIVYWIMGSLSGVGFEDILRILPLYVVAIVILYLYRWRINVLSLGDREARSFGVDVKRDRSIIIVASSVLTALVVSISGIIGWVGIVVPHLARMMVGPDFRKLIPASTSLGICYMLVIDDICRTLTASEIPIGVVTGIIGVPMFLYFIYKRKVNW